MAKKNKIHFLCTECGQDYSKWSGKCDNCGEWDTIKEYKIPSAGSTSSNGIVGIVNSSLSKNKICKLIESSQFIVPSISTGISEFDRVLGNGIVSGSVTLLGGAPGIGKSTLVLQVVNNLVNAEIPVCYVSGEESLSQIAKRGERLNVSLDKIDVLNSNDVDEILSIIYQLETKPQLVIIDSIQTTVDSGNDSFAGSPNQIRYSTNKLVKFAKSNNIAIILIGHITKEGHIAGPKLLEHMVDVVLYFDDDHGDMYRIIKVEKNRFGASNEICLFEMTSSGLEEVLNPSNIFLPKSMEDAAPGSIIFPTIQGSKAILVEIQSLVPPTNISQPRRAVVGWDLGRLNMIIAVLNTYYNINLFNREIYLNILSGIKIADPAADLAATAAVISSVIGKCIGYDTVIMGEVSLTGAVRKINNLEKRLNESAKLGFKRAIIPYNMDLKNRYDGMEVISIKNIFDLISYIK